MEITGYRLLSELNVSDHAVIYRAVRPGDNKRVIIKQYKDSVKESDVQSEYRKLIRAGKSLCPEVLSFEKRHGRPILVMPDQNLMTLNSHLQRSPEDKIIIIERLLAVMHNLHQKGIIHGRIDPGHVLIGPDNSVKLTGLSYRISESCCDYRFLAPERTGIVSQEADHRSDWFSAGAVAFYLLSGRTVFEAEDREKYIYKLITENPPSILKFVPEADRSVADIIDGLIQTGVSERRFTLKDRRSEFSPKFKLISSAAESGYILPPQAETAVHYSSTAADKHWLHIYGEKGIGKTKLLKSLKYIHENRNTPVFETEVGSFDTFQQITGSLINKFKEYIFSRPSNLFQNYRTGPGNTSILAQLSEKTDYTGTDFIHTVIRKIIEIQGSVCLIFDNVVPEQKTNSLFHELLRNHKKGFYLITSYTSEISRVNYVKSIRLERLGSGILKKLILKWLDLPVQDPDGLTGIILEKTGGNPGEAFSFIQEAVKKNLIALTEGESSSQWVWHAGITKLPRTANLVKDSLDRLSREKYSVIYTLKLLAIGARSLPGFTFDLMLADLDIDTDEILKYAVQAGYITDELAAGLPFFAHPDIKNKVLNVIQPEMNGRIHGTIALRLLEQNAPAAGVFPDKLVAHINEGLQFIKNRICTSDTDRFTSFREHCIRLLLKHSVYLYGHFQLLRSANTARLAVSLITDNDKKNRPGLAFEIIIFAAKVSLLNGSIYTSEALTDEASKLARTETEHAKVAVIRSHTLLARRDFASAKSNTEKFCKVFRKRIRRNLFMQILPLRLRYRFFIKKTNSLHAKPLGPDGEIYSELLYLRFLIAVGENDPAHERFAVERLVTLPFDKSDQQTLQSVLFIHSKNPEKSSVKIQEKRDRLIMSTRAFTAGSRIPFVYTMLSPESRKYPERVLRRLEQLLDQTAITGDEELILFILNAILQVKIWLGYSESELRRTFSLADSLVVSKSKTASGRNLQFFRKVFEAVFESRNPENVFSELVQYRFTSDAFEPETSAHIHDMVLEQNQMCLILYMNILVIKQPLPGDLFGRIFNLVINYFSFIIIETLEAFLAYSLYYQPMNRKWRTYYRALKSRLKTRQSQGSERAAFRLEALNTIYRLKKQKDASPEIITDRLEILIREALNKGQDLESAALNLIAGDYLVRYRKGKKALLFFFEALEIFQRWGTAEPVRRIINQINSLKDYSFWPVMPSESGTAEPVNYIETRTLLNMARIVNTEIRYDKLTNVLTDLACKFSGANYGTLLLHDSAIWKTGARNESGNKVTNINKEYDIDQDYEDTLVCNSIIRSCIRSGQPVVLNDAAVSGPYTGDRWILRNGSKSVLAMPLSIRGDIAGVLFLENRNSAGVFSEQKIQALTMLSAHMATALEHARIYENLEERISQRTSELQEQKSKAEQATILKDRFLSLVSHDMKTPLVGIQMMLRMLQKDTPELTAEKRNRIIDQLSRSTDTSINMINNLLDLDRLKNGVIVPRIRRVDLSQVIRDLISEMSPAAAARNVQIEYHGPLNEIVNTDDNLFREVLRNILSNAVRYTRLGSCVRIDVTSDRIYIEDEGPGFDLDSLKSNQNEDYDAESDGLPSYTSHGLGIGFAKELISVLHGRLLLETSGLGSRVGIEIPRNGPVVLIVDKDHKHRRKICNSLKKLALETESPLPFTIAESEDKASAEKQIRLTPPDIILYDLQQEPVQEDIEFIKVHGPDRVIWCMGNIDDFNFEPVKRAVTDAGASGISQKPVDENDIQEIVVNKLKLLASRKT